MNKILTSIIAAFALLVFAVPTSAQITTMGPADCLICNPDCAFSDWHTDFSHPDGPWGTLTWHGYVCSMQVCSDRHEWCNGLASAEDVERRNRINEILNTMEGDERVAALINEYPQHTHLTSSGDALEVMGAACQDGQVVGRLNLTMRQAVAVIDAKADSRLAVNF